MSTNRANDRAAELAWDEVLIARLGERNAATFLESHYTPQAREHLLVCSATLEAKWAAYERATVAAWSHVRS